MHASGSIGQLTVFDSGRGERAKVLVLHSGGWHHKFHGHWQFLFWSQLPASNHKDLMSIVAFSASLLETVNANMCDNCATRTEDGRTIFEDEQRKQKSFGSKKDIKTKHTHKMNSNRASRLWSNTARSTKQSTGECEIMKDVTKMPKPI